MCVTLQGGARQKSWRLWTITLGSENVAETHLGGLFLVLEACLCRSGFGNFSHLGKRDERDRGLTSWQRWAVFNLSTRTHAWDNLKFHDDNITAAVSSSSSSSSLQHTYYSKQRGIVADKRSNNNMLSWRSLNIQPVELHDVSL